MNALQLSIKKVLVFFILLCLLPFNNCGVPDNTRPFTQTSESHHSLSPCDRGGLNTQGCKELLKEEEKKRMKFIELQIQSSNPIYLKTDENFINVSGVCNNAGFEDHRIVWSLYKNQKLIDENSTHSDSSGHSDQEEDIYCINGEFFLRVPVVPSLYENSTLNLEIELIVYNDAGFLIPSSFKNKKSIQLALSVEDEKDREDEENKEDEED